jgi:hypothetical protein
MRIIFLLATAMLIGAALPDQPRTAAEVIALDRQWSRAEDDGDVAWLEALLSPDYQSIATDGSAIDRDHILAGARRNATLDPAQRRDMAARNAAWAAQHAGTTRVVLLGNTAVLTSISKIPGKTGLVMSCDVFAWRNGRWHALYSQHSNA